MIGRRMAAAAAAVGTVVLGACGGGSTAPERDDFVRLLVEESDRTISQATANCIYDEIGGDDDLLRALARDGELTDEQALRRDEAIATCLTGG